MLMHAHGDCIIQYVKCELNTCYTCRPTLLEYDLLDQICVDHGKEFILTLYVQDKL